MARNLTSEEARDMAQQAAKARRERSAMLQNPRLPDGGYPDTLLKRLIWLDQVCGKAGWQDASGILRTHIRAIRLDKAISEVR